MFHGSLSIYMVLFLSLLSCILIGYDLSFNVYALQMKYTFNFTQTQVEVVGSTVTCGMVAGWLDTVISPTLGYQYTYLFIILIVPLSSSLLGLIVIYKDAIGDCFLLVCLLELILSTLMNVAYVAISRVSVEQISDKHTGKVLGVFMSAICAGKFLCCYFFQSFFADDLAGFFFTLAGSSLILFGLCFFFLHRLKEGKLRVFGVESNGASTETQPLKHDLSTVEIESSVERETSVSDMLKSPFFHVNFWWPAFFYASAYTLQNNIAVIADSVWSTNPLNNIYILTIAMLIPRNLYSYLFDKYPSEWFGFFLLAITYGALLFAILIGEFWLNNEWMFVMSALIGWSNGPGPTLPLAIIIHRFGRGYYSGLLGAYYSVTGMGMIILQIATGLFYDFKGYSFDFRCYSKECYSEIFAIMITIIILAFIVQLVHLSLPFIKSFEEFRLRNIANACKEESCKEGLSRNQTNG